MNKSSIVQLSRPCNCCHKEGRDTMVQSASSSQIQGPPARAEAWIRDRHQEIRRDTIADHILQALGQPATKIEPVHEGFVHILFRASIGDSTVYLKMATKGRSMLAEVQALELAARQRILVPRIIHYGHIANQAGVSCLILARLSGDSTAHIAASRKNTVYEAAGSLLRQLHKIQADGFGRLSFHWSAENSWEDSVTNQMVTDIAQMNRTGLLKPDENEALQRILDDALSRELLVVRKPRLLHMDLQSPHIIAGEDGQIGILDFHKASGGDPLYDLVMFSCYEGAQALSSLLRGYTNAMESIEQKQFYLRFRQTAPFYCICFALEKIAWGAVPFQGISLPRLIGDYERNFLSTS
jgi:fructosamine-3-kinase